jgi:hypothetical protein
VIDKRMIPSIHRRRTRVIRAAKISFNISSGQFKPSTKPSFRSIGQVMLEPSAPSSQPVTPYLSSFCTTGSLLERRSIGTTQLFTQASVPLVHLQSRISIIASSAQWQSNVDTELHKLMERSDTNRYATEMPWSVATRVFDAMTPGCTYDCGSKFEFTSSDDVSRGFVCRDQ